MLVSVAQNVGFEFRVATARMKSVGLSADLLLRFPLRRGGLAVRPGQLCQELIGIAGLAPAVFLIAFLDLILQFRAP